ncbi:hypothetical protein TBLA_0A02950 [Henningerozyma blattae CBS 6284]|uniref:Zn(2)-C6 fungal-type domain-containing protein n=1 Tax=Henningerozyma blattae (strain ATCC 34711 / CBS 6284 / DSM 70876 / NBRC 10599 / NRRL Y-10934 / UCD 77-7) TaxID=1071380 RepID=I2GVE3_HENB6|nr:hypothetical protein TBLA_0A02950 [Tetrapisispora blattae CBS 6284]CCH58095.1 hypothetical protein TBLA_0A02950 [Tetrapisispora blattae CBS 6284]
MDVRVRRMKKPPACTQCRKRKVGCDRVKPVCGNCMKNNRGQQCFYPNVPGQFMDAASMANVPTGISKAAELDRSLSYIQQKESMIFSPQYNSELASLEQIREYNTRLQLLNNSNLSSNLNALNKNGLNTINSTGNGPNNKPKFIPRTSLPQFNKSAKFESKKVSKLNNDDKNSVNLNWIQGPAIFDLKISRYSKYEILAKELDFIKSRLLELQDLTGKDLSNLNLSWNNNPFRDLIELSNQHNHNNNNDDDECTSESENENSSDEDISDDNTTSAKNTSDNNGISSNNTNVGDNPTTLSSSTEFDKYTVMDPEFINKNEVFNFMSFKTNYSKSPNSIFPQVSDNNIFDSNYLASKDYYLTTFYEILQNVISKEFSPELEIFKRSQLESKVPENIARNNHMLLKFPRKSISLKIIEFFQSTVAEAHILFPFINIKDMHLTISQFFASNEMNNNSSENTATPIVKLDPTNFNLNNLIELGNISVVILLTYESLNSTVLLPLKDDDLIEIYKELKYFNIHLLENLKIIESYILNSEFISYSNSGSIINSVKFISFKKFLYSIKSDFYQLPDLNEDINWSRKFSLNLENSNTSLIQIWNFNYKNYCWRHLYKGGIPNLANTIELNSNLIVDPLLALDYSLLKFQSDFLKVLHINDHLIKLERVENLKLNYKIKINDLKNSISNLKHSNISSSIHHIVDALIYRNSMLFWSYYLLLHYELNDNLIKFQEVYKDLLQLIQETLFYVFSNLASLKFAGYEFFFANKSFLTLTNIVQIIFILHSRCSSVLKNSQTNKPTSSTKSDTLSAPPAKDDKEGNNITNKNNDTSSTSSSSGSIDENFIFQMNQKSNYLVLLLQKILMLLNDYSKNCKTINPLLKNICAQINTFISFIDMSNSIYAEKYFKNLPNPPHTNMFEKFEITYLIRFVNKLHNVSESLIKKDFYALRSPYSATEKQTLGITKENISNVFSAFCT